MHRDSFFRASAAVVVTLAAGCNGSSAASRSSAPVSDLHDLYSAGYSGLIEPQRSVVTHEADWAALWDTVTANESPRPSKPPVDLSRQSIIVAALGEKSSGGFAIHIDSIRAAGEGRDVFVTTTRPGPSCATVGAMTQPVHIVAAPASSGPMRFVETDTTTGCGS